MWSPEPEIVTEARELLETHWAQLAGAGEDRALLARELLEAAGTLVRCAEPVPCSDEPAATVVRQAARHALEAWDVDGLVAAAGELVRVAPAVGDPEHPGHDAAADTAVGVLEQRDEVELCLAGLGALFPELQPGDELVSAVCVFDDLVRPVLWRLIPLNVIRAARLAWMAPRERASHWWWHTGVELPPQALEWMDAVAGLTTLFPEAARAFDALRAAQLRLVSARATGRALSLADRLSFERPSNDAGALWAAAATSAPLRCSWPEADLAFYSGRLQIDLLEDVSPERVPELRDGSGAIERGEGVLHSVGRYTLSLERVSPHATTPLWLTIPRRRGELRLDPRALLARLVDP